MHIKGVYQNVWRYIYVKVYKNMSIGILHMNGDKIWRYMYNVGIGIYNIYYTCWYVLICIDIVLLVYILYIVIYIIYERAPGHQEELLLLAWLGGSLALVLVLVVIQPIPGRIHIQVIFLRILQDRISSTLGKDSLWPSKLSRYI